MKLKRVALSILVFILVGSGIALASSQWKNSSSLDPMTNEMTWYAISPYVTSTSKMSFPYTGTEAWIGIGKDSKDEWVYIGFTKEPNLVNTKIGNGYDSVKIRIKWDDELTETTLTQTWGSKFLHFSNDHEIISRISKHNKVLIELEWYGSGKVYFEFPLSGSAKAIKTMRDAFSK